MSIALICYIVAAVMFVLAALYPRPWNALPIGLFFFVCGHILAGVAFKAV